MSSRRIAPVLALFIALLVGGLLLSGCGPNPTASGEREQQLFTCGMHPQVVQSKPGNCPICGMKLTPIHKGGDNSSIVLDPVTTQNMGLRTALVTRGPLRRVIRTVGSIDYNETALAEVTTKFKGWIEKLNVDTTGQQVHRGEALFEIYSPELYSAQREYLLAVETSANASARDSLKTSALTKLKFFDISDEQIAELERTAKPHKALQIQAPIDGFVVEKMVVEGQMVEAGMKIYRLADLGLVWVQAQVYEQDLVYLKLGQEATVSLSYLPDREFRGRVTYIYPNVDEKTRTARVRMEFHNPGFFLKPGMFATVQVAAELEPSVLLVPDMAVLRSGQKNTVFVALDGGKFEPRTVILGPEAENDQYEVLTGLNEGDRIVTSGQFMLDSESQLREAIQKMQPPGASRAANLAGDTGLPATSGESPSQLSKSNTSTLKPSLEVKYICPMPEHVAIEYGHPGKCPICGMALVPVPVANLHQIQPGGKLQYYTCPMPEHSDVRSDKPGKCPKCGMTLIPVMSSPPTGEMRKERSNSVTEAALPTLYTCPMPNHADIVSDKPGKCPKCNMDLVAVTTVAHGKTAVEHWRQAHANQIQK